MTVTLSVSDVLRQPALFDGRFRLCVRGVLQLEASTFRVFEARGDGDFDASIAMDIDDEQALAMTRAALSNHGHDTWLGLAWIEAWTRFLDEGGVTRVSLRDVVNLYLGPDIVGALRIAVRPHPWGWDR